MDLTKKAMWITLPVTGLSFFAELSAVLYELVSYLNLRPLTVGDGENLLTPAHLLFGVRSLTGVLSPAVGQPVDPDRAWRKRCHVSDNLQRRWQREYTCSRSAAGGPLPVALPKDCHWLKCDLSLQHMLSEHDKMWLSK